MVVRASAVVALLVPATAAPTRSESVVPAFTIGGVAPDIGASHAHPQRHAFSFTFSGQTFEVDAERSDDLFSPEYAETVHTDAGISRVPASQTANAPANLCHYYGRVHGDPRSAVAFSTCHGGIDGRIWAHGHDLVMRPGAAPAGGGHVPVARRRRLDGVQHSVAPYDEVTEDGRHSHCGVADHTHASHLTRDRRQLAIIGGTRKYIEVMVVNDKSRVDEAGGEPSIPTLAATGATIINQVAQHYQSITWSSSVLVKVVIVGQHFFKTADPYEVVLYSPRSS